MLAVTGYPIGYAVWLSLQRNNLATPNDNAFIGLGNYQTILTDRYWWTALAVTLAITVVSVSIEFVLGLTLALVMHRTLVGKGLVRTAVLIPYGIVTAVAAYSWFYAWTPGTGYLANLLPHGSAPLTEQIPSLGIVVLAEVWKTTPFMSLLLLAGLALVPEDLLKAAQVDGAGAWRRLTRIILPLIKPAVVVALLFRTLDAFRIFDNIYVLTEGANDTDSVSILGYDNLFKGFNVGLGSAISVLVFWCVGIIAVLFIKVFGAAAPGGVPVAGRPISVRRTAFWVVWVVIDTLVVVYALLPVLWILSLSLKPTSMVKDGRLIPSSVTLENYRGIFRGEFFSSALINSVGIGLTTTVIAVVLGAMAAYAIARLDFPGKRLLIGATLLVTMFPAISLVTPLFNIERRIGLFDTWPGLILPYITFALPLAIYTLSAFFREIPWDLEKAAKMDGATPAQAFRKVIVPLAAPGLVTAAILVFIFAWNDLLLALSLTATKAAITAPVAIVNFSGSSQFEEPTGSIAAGAIVITVPIIVFVLIFQRRIVAGLTSGAVKG